MSKYKITGIRERERERDRDRETERDREREREREREKIKLFIYEGNRSACMLFYIQPLPKQGTTLDLIIHVHIF